MNAPEILKPLKTWSHLAGRRRKPSEYEIVSTNLHYTTDNPNAPFELDPNMAMAEWFKKNRNASPLQHADWNAFRDPDEIVYRTYNMLQDGQETYVFGPPRPVLGARPRRHARAHLGGQPGAAVYAGSLPVPRLADGFGLSDADRPGLDHFQLRGLPVGRFAALADPYGLSHGGTGQDLRRRRLR